MKLLTKRYFSADKTHAAVADIADIYPPVRGDIVTNVSRQHARQSGVSEHPNQKEAAR
jgi:hypothetical protein